MHCFYICDITKGLEKDQIKQIEKVLRIKENEKIVVFDDFKYYECFWDVKSKRLKIINENKIEKVSNNIDFYVPLLKNNNFKVVIQKLTEIGVRKIIPFESNRTIVKEKNDKMNRFKKIITEAAEQSRNFSFPKIESIQKLDKIDFSNYDFILIGYENEKTKKLNNVLPKIKKTQKIACIIGPEGGFDYEEITTMEEQYEKVEIISLGENILRAETAVIYLAAILKNHLGG